MDTCAGEENQDGNSTFALKVLPQLFSQQIHPEFISESTNVVSAEANHEV